MTLLAAAPASAACSSRKLRRSDQTPTVIEKDFWVCWTLRRLGAAPDLRGHITIKGGTSLSKAYGVIQRFSEDIDLTIRRSAPLLDKVASPMEGGIGTNERQRRTRALKAAAQEYVATIAMPALAAAIETQLGKDGWSTELDPEDRDSQTILFNYPRTGGRFQPFELCIASTVDFLVDELGQDPRKELQDKPGRNDRPPDCKHAQDSIFHTDERCQDPGRTSSGDCWLRAIRGPVFRTRDARRLMEPFQHRFGWCSPANVRATRHSSRHDVRARG
jgi:hypothetical protein